MNDIEKWARTTQALEITTNNPLLIYPLPSQPVITSIQTILSTVNVTGLSATDIQLIKNEFKALRNNNVSLDRDEIEAYLMQQVNYGAWEFILEFRKYSKI